MERGNMMKKLTEIRWHGRGGQGAKTASLLLADVAFSTGLYIQGFPEYGPENGRAHHHRLTASPMSPSAYTPTFTSPTTWWLWMRPCWTLSTSPLAWKPEGGIVINSAKDPPSCAPKLKGYTGKVYTIDAKKISIECIGETCPTPHAGCCGESERLHG